MTSPTNRSVFLTMLQALGSKDFDTFERCLDADLLCDRSRDISEIHESELSRGAAVPAGI